MSNVRARFLTSSAPISSISSSQRVCIVFFSSFSLGLSFPPFLICITSRITSCFLFSLSLSLSLYPPSPLSLLCRHHSRHRVAPHHPHHALHQIQPANAAAIFERPIGQVFGLPPWGSLPSWLGLSYSDAVVASASAVVPKWDLTFLKMLNFYNVCMRRIILHRI